MWFRRSKKAKEDAETALEESKQKLKEVIERGPEVTALSKAFKDFREKNHIAEQLEEILLRKGGKLT
jgi:hypothetical protein